MAATGGAPIQVITSFSFHFFIKNITIYNIFCSFFEAKTQNYFANLGINVCNAYGMSETCGLSSFNTQEKFQV